MSIGDQYGIEVSAENTEKGTVMTFAADSVGVSIEVTLSDGSDTGHQYAVMKSMADDLPDLIDECINRMVIWRKAEAAHDA